MQPLAGRGERDKYREPVMAGYCITAKNEPLGRHLDDVVDGKRVLLHTFTITGF
jgi:hypothetical protein